MTHIDQISVRGLAGRSDGRTFQLNSDVNVFFGLNGTGKTALLRLIHSALAFRSRDLKKIAFTDATVHIRNVIALSPEDENVITDVKRSTDVSDLVTLQMSLVGAPIAPSSMQTSSDSKRWHSFSEKEIEPGFQIKHTYLPISRLYTAEGRSVPRARRETVESPNLSETELERIFAETIHFLWLRYTRNLGIEIQAAQAEGLSAILADFLAPDELINETYAQPDPSQAYRRLMTFLSRHSKSETPMISEAAFSARIQSDARMHRVIRDIEAAELKVQQIRKPRSEFARILKDMLSSGKSLQLGERDIHALAGDSEIGLENISSGEKHLLRICVDVLLADGQPVLIDEPELSMHIDWQRKLIPALRDIAPKSQLIIATHSPEIMASLTEEQIIEL